MTLILIVMLVAFPQAPTPSATNTPEGKWKVSTAVEEGKPALSLTVAGELPKSVSLSTATGLLSLRCKDSAEVSVMMFTSPASEPAQGDLGSALVRLGFGSSQPKVIKVSRGMPGNVLFFPEPKPTIETILTTEDLLFEFTPQGSQPQVVRFNVRGLSAVLPKLKDACGWK